MTNLFLNCLSHDKLPKAATIRKRLWVVLAPAALAVGGAMMNHATPATGATPVANAKAGPPAQDVTVANPATAPVLVASVDDLFRDTLCPFAHCLGCRSGEEGFQFADRAF
jgi:hypothetical protein